jgi:hypothetical protein
MIYAVSAQTLQRFENALGRHIHRRLGEAEERGGEGDAGEHPHLVFVYAMYQANALYSPKAQGISGAGDKPANLDRLALAKTFPLQASFISTTSCDTATYWL